MGKLPLLLLSLGVILATAIVVYQLNSKPVEYKPGQWTDFDTAINQAKHVYRLQKEQGVDFSKGPCLTEALMPGWVADIVHNPRQSADDSPQNQCYSYAEGKAKHFVELDTEGNFVRAK